MTSARDEKVESRSMNSSIDMGGEYNGRIVAVTTGAISSQFASMRCQDMVRHIRGMFRDTVFDFQRISEEYLKN